MEMFELVLLLLGAVLVSTVLDQMMPRVSLPLVQIALGVVIIVLVGVPVQVDIDPELFLVLFIAPLLFDESRHASKRALWDNKGAILSLAVGLVLVTVLVVGFVLNWLEPTIPLAAAFALGAALGPTDAVAVTALGKDIRLSKRQNTLLSGEALINDASGVVSFQFAIAAAVTGAFSLAEAASTFAVSFFGGILLGLALGLVAAVALRLIRKQGFESVTVHVVFEVFTPFLVFLVAEHVGVSGILAVVAAGLLITLLPKESTPASARLKLASDSVWETLVFVINGVVFVLLGMQLPRAIMPTWNGPADALNLVGLVLLITLLVEGVRFVWVLGMETFARKGKLAKGAVRDALVTTLAGPKGAVTLSIAFTVPFSLADGSLFPNRDMLIFLASGVILCTLLLANFVVPLLAPKADEEDDDAVVQAANIAILERVVLQLKAEETPDTELATRIVVRQYEERIKRLRRQSTSAACLMELRVGVLDCQRAYVEQCMAEGVVTPAEGQRYLEQFEHMREMLLHRQAHQNKGARVFRHAKMTATRTVRSMTRMFAKPHFSGEEMQAARAFRVGLEQCSLDFLETKTDDPNVEVAEGAAMLAAECRATLAAFELRDDHASDGRPPREARGPLTRDPDAIEEIKVDVTEIETEALRLELDEIQRMREAGTLGRETARELREEVYLLQMTVGD
ncbi:Na+/H+ antiporter [Eggerthella sinensis]|uniref:Na+/H+ antiporter n=1 Tax=Eggerthella sinensis TaxID=242230 RepID=UPI001D07A7CC|nr:Na+/H+ antiporter [Eggerthella sinensis]MCB7036829.1 Na+/H+ antiporter [Eggerthella sinensis]